MRGGYWGAFETIWPRAQRFSIKNAERSSNSMSERHTTRRSSLDWSVRRTGIAFNLFLTEEELAKKKTIVITILSCAKSWALSNIGDPELIWFFPPPFLIITPPHTPHPTPSPTICKRWVHLAVSGSLVFHPRWRFNSEWDEGKLKKLRVSSCQSAPTPRPRASRADGGGAHLIRSFQSAGEWRVAIRNHLPRYGKPRSYSDNQQSYAG